MNVSVQPTPDPDTYEFEGATAEDGSACVTGTITRTAKGLAISTITVTTDVITGRTLRSVRLAEILQHARAQIPTPAARELPPTPEPARPGRAPLTDELLRSVAEAYLRETAPGKERGPVRRMAEEFGRPEETIRTWLTRCRKAGWLGPTAQGRAGAEPGPRLTAR